MNDEKALPPVLTMDAPERTLDVVTLEIQTLQRQAIEVNLMYAIEIGRRLTEAKAMLPHGQWGDYLKTQVSYSQSTANNLMKVFREYGADQQSLFGAAKSQTFATLPYSKALRLLAIPDEEEREQFAADHDLDSMSVRELEKAIKARDEAQQKAAAAKEEAERLREENAAVQEEAERLRKDAQAAEEERQRASSMAQRLQTALSDANANAQNAATEQERLQRELEVLKARTPEVRDLTPEEKEALTAAEVEKARAEDAERLREMEKLLAQADPDTAAFKVLFTAWQEDFRKVREVLSRIAQTDAEKASRLQTAVKTVLAQMGGV